nr:MAG TPA: hypothetical protein [Caudoviricetes sp.]
MIKIKAVNNDCLFLCLWVQCFQNVYKLFPKCFRRYRLRFRLRFRFRIKKRHNIQTSSRFSYYAQKKSPNEMQIATKWHELRFLENLKFYPCIFLFFCV